MNRRMAVGLGLLLLVIAVLMPFSGRGGPQKSSRRVSVTYPPKVSATIDEALERYEQVLNTKAPAVAAELRPGLTAEEIDELEARYDVVLNSDLRALYRWHNGTTSFSAELVPGHYFPPLEEALQTRDALKKDLVNAPQLQRLMISAFVGDKMNWVHVLADGSGDGYFYDPDYGDEPGAFFYHFTEDACFVRFQTLTNFLVGAIECWDQGAYDYDPVTARLKEDPWASRPIWQRYGVLHN